MNREEEVVFTFAKYKAVFKRYFYVVIICIVIAVAYMGISVMKTRKITTQNSNVDDENNMTQEVQLSGTEYFKKNIYVGVDWSEQYPQQKVDENTSVEDGEKIMNIINDNVQIEKNILLNCSPIINYKIFKDRVNQVLQEKGKAELSDNDNLGLTIFSERQYSIYVYSQSSIERMNTLLDAANDVFISIANENFSIGKCKVIGYSDVTISSKNADGSYVDKNIRADEYIKNGLNIKNADALNIVTENNQDTTLMSKKELIIGIGIFALGFIIVGIISLFDKKIYTIKELDGLNDIRVIGKISNNDNVLVERLSERINKTGKLAYISTDIEQENTVIKQIKKLGMEIENIVWEDSKKQIYFGKYDNAVIVVRQGKDAYKNVLHILDELKIDNVNIIGYIWNDEN